MKRASAFLLATVFGLGGFVVGLFSSRGVETLVHGTAEEMVITQDLALSFGLGSDAVPSCPGERRGGILAGTPVTVRKHGSIHRIEVDVSTSGRELPLRPIQSTERGNTGTVLTCATVRGAGT